MSTKKYKTKPHSPGDGPPLEEQADRRVTDTEEAERRPDLQITIPTESCQSEANDPIAFLVASRPQLIRRLMGRGWSQADAADAHADAMLRVVRYGHASHALPAAVGHQHFGYATADAGRRLRRHNDRKAAVACQPLDRTVSPEEQFALAEEASVILNRARELAADHPSLAIVLDAMVAGLEGDAFSPRALAALLRVQPNRVYRLCAEARRLVAAAREDIAAE